MKVVVLFWLLLIVNTFQNNVGVLRNVVVREQNKIYKKHGSSH